MEQDWEFEVVCFLEKVMANSEWSDDILAAVAKKLPKRSLFLNIPAMEWLKMLRSGDVLAARKIYREERRV